MAAISIEGLGKRYRLGQRRSAFAFRDRLRHRRDESEVLWALRDVSFEVAPGEVIGIIGANGAGKSTLLKILSRITTPTEGRAVVEGRVRSLLEVGTGFHPELTGRENVFLNGAILGMSRRETVSKFDEIVEFSGIERFIDTPVKRYSSGMYIRLAFAVAAHLEPEVLLIDEVLAVGDAAFQKRCLGKIESVAQEGRTVLFVSHNLRAVSALCSRAVLLSGGRVAVVGQVADVIDSYESGVRSEMGERSAEFFWPDDPSLEGQITGLRLLNAEGRPSLRHGVLEPMDVEITFVLRRDYSTLGVTVQLWTSDNTLALATLDSDWDNFSGESMRDDHPRQAGNYRAVLHIPAPLLNTGLYEIEAVLTPGPVRVDTKRGIFFEVVDRSSYLSFVSKARRGGVIAVPCRWEVDLIPAGATSRELSG